MGISDFIKNLFPQKTNQDAPPLEPENILIKNVDFKKIINDSYREVPEQGNWWLLKATDFITFNQKVLTLSSREKTSFTLYLLQRVHHFHDTVKSYSYGGEPHRKVEICKAFLAHLFKSRFEMDADDLEAIIMAALRYNKKHGFPARVPLKSILNQIEKKFTQGSMPANLSKAVYKLQARLKHDKEFSPETETFKLLEQIDIILNPVVNEAIKPVLFPGQDAFVDFANLTIVQLPVPEKLLWYQLIACCKNAPDSKPSKKYLLEGSAIINQFEPGRFASTVNILFEFLIGFKGIEVRSQQTYGNQTYNSVSFGFISAPATECVKGLVWQCANLTSGPVLNHIALLAGKTYRKIAGYGQVSTAIGNACLYTLYKTAGTEGIGHLSRLKVRIKLNSTSKLIEKYLALAAAERNLPPGDLEDLVVDDLELLNGERIFEIEDYKAILSIEKVGRVNIAWVKPDGSTQKTEPSSLKEKHAPLLKELKQTAKQIELGLSAQRDRIDTSFKLDRKMPWAHFNDCYFNHGLVSYIARQLIWQFELPDGRRDVLWNDEKWIDAREHEVDIAGVTSVSLWHPSTATVNDVQLWRNLLIKHQLQQPIKQAFREVYLLTDAELNTVSYSNRMAAHILKQHQFNQLAKIRGWKYTLQGQFDNGADGIASMSLPAIGLKAEYWTNVVDPQGAASANSMGIYNYLVTDQVRFQAINQPGMVALLNVPPVIFSEIMRDVDLFVGVSSVGNDPAWRDSGGLPASYDTYWESYSFGELTEVAKNRRETLERLLPYLKIAKIAHLKDKFLVVKGKKRTYKIHLGSTNILMEPNDQYLCIVPDRSSKPIAENLFLPFDGDTGLSIIISKAFLLADDDQIKDVTITRQIGG